MNAQDWEMLLVSAFADVEVENAYGYRMFFVGVGRKLPFVSIAESDNEYDAVSDLDREGVFRINIGVSKATFERMFPEGHAEDLEFSALDVFMPHPHYAKQNFICILNPGLVNVDVVAGLIAEAHGIASERAAKD